MSDGVMPLRYGCNPHQVPARALTRDGPLPLQVLNGQPGYINLLDALNSWQLVRELKHALELPAAASFKHTSPAGAAVGLPLSPAVRQSCFVDDQDLSPLACAYARARGADRVSSFGDWVALSDRVDLATARLLKREVSDGVIAPDFDPDALALLKEKRKGSYVILQVDPDYEPPALETREVFGVLLEQRRNDATITAAALGDAVTRNGELTAEGRRDLLVALIALKYTQSNSVGLAYDGQMIGLGAGQQSRILCTRHACTQADKWFLRQHPAVLDLEFRPGIARPERDNAIDQFLQDDLTNQEQVRNHQAFARTPRPLTAQEKRAWLDTMSGVSLASDGFIPFRDNVDRAARSGVRFITEPGNSLRDAEVVAACDQYGMVMVFCDVRLFHH